MLTRFSALSGTETKHFFERMENAGWGAREKR
jgi:hypothetical protein